MLIFIVGCVDGKIWNIFGNKEVVFKVLLNREVFVMKANCEYWKVGLFFFLLDFFESRLNGRFEGFI